MLGTGLSPMSATKRRLHQEPQNGRQDCATPKTDEQQARDERNDVNQADLKQYPDFGHPALIEEEDERKRHGRADQEYGTEPEKTPLQDEACETHFATRLPYRQGPTHRKIFRCLTVGRSAASRASAASGPSEGEGGESAATPC
jgi:hypothetical protein